MKIIHLILFICNIQFGKTFVIQELARVLKPGGLLGIHCDFEFEIINSSPKAKQFGSAGKKIKITFR